jgi:hypothetical protein
MSKIQIKTLAFYVNMLGATLLFGQLSKFEMPQMSVIPDLTPEIIYLLTSATLKCRESYASALEHRFLSFMGFLWDGDAGWDRPRGAILSLSFMMLQPSPH